MAYVEIWKSGRLLTRRRVDEEKARKGCRVRLGPAGEVQIAVDQSETLGSYEVRMFTGDPPKAQPAVKGDVPAKENDIRTRPTLDFSVGAPPSDAGRTGMRPDIEGYKIVEPLGEGGMGTVWRAEQLSTKRQVALKVMAASRFASEKAQARFEREVELTARLDHPNIARIYDSGLHHGMYYYAMELIDGIPLDQYVKGKVLSKNEILALMQKVCQAVLYAHLRAVIHRDLKPSNILVSADGQPHVLDFGLAKALLDDDEALTISIEGQIAGTPAYMSPEQATGHHSQLDTRTDVYSLGVILYELLVGQSPHDLSGSMFDLLHQIAEGRIRRPREINKSIDAELEAILLKALARNPEDRYASAGALAKDIGSYLDEEPLDARVSTTLYFLRKKARKYRLQVAAILVVLLLVFGTVVVAYTWIVKGITLRDALAMELELSKRTWGELEAMVSGNNEKDALVAFRVLQDKYASAQEQISQLNHRLGERKPPVSVRRVDLAPGPALASTALVRTPSLLGGIESWTLETYGHRGRIAKLVYSSDSRQLASKGSDGIVRVWDAQSGQLTRISVDPNGVVAMPGFTNSRDASQFSWSADEATRTIEETTRLWGVDWAAGWSGSTAGLRTATAIALCPDRSGLAFGDRDGTIRVLDLKGGQLRHTEIPAWCGPIQSICFSPDRRVLATCAGLGTICLWDAHRWEPLRKFETAGITGGSTLVVSSIAWAPHGAAIARANSRQRLVEILDSQSGGVLRVLSAPAHGINSLGWSPDGRLVVAGTVGGTVYSWDIATDSNEPSATFPAHAGSVNALAWTRQGQNLITAGDDGKIEIWEPRSGTLTRSIEGYPDPITCLAFSGEGNVLAAGSENGIIRLWDAGGSWTSMLLRSEPNDTQARESKFTAVAWSPDGALLVSGDSAGHIKIWDPNSRRPTRSLAANCGLISSLAWSPDGRVLLSGGADGTVRVWDANDDFQEHVVLLPLWGSVGPGIAINASGDYRGPLGIEDHLVYALRTADGPVTLSPADFQSQYGWVNEPWQVGLYKPGAENVERIYVKAASKGPYDGKTWETAFSDLQDALSIAQPNTEIWVAAGTYTPDRGTGARTASFHLKNGVRLLGGFAGTETNSSQRDPNNNETILSGDLKANDKPNFVNNDENSYHVLVAHDSDSSNTVLDGFVITGGNANDPRTMVGGNLDHYGGGLLVQNCGLTLIGCIFRYNSSIQEGGGIFHDSGRSILQNCTFIANRVSYCGGAVSSHQGKAVVISCKFIRNSAGHGGGAYLDRDSSAFIDCTFTGNSAYLEGESSSAGGLLILYPGSVILTNCRFFENSADRGGGVFIGQNGNPKVTNCIFNNNLATSWGGGIYTQDARIHPTLFNCTIVANKSLFAGCGIYNDPNGSPLLVNCIVWHNIDGNNKMSESEQMYGGFPVINNCCIQGWTGKLGGTANFALDPLFVDPNGPDGRAGTLDDDLRLDLASPCRNAGNNSALGADTADLDKDGDVNEPIPFDIDGKPRIQGGTVDIGAYESN